MELILRRKPSSEHATIGELYYEGNMLCYTLEDVVRETSDPVSTWKIAGETAIPQGRRKITITYSPHFSRLLPLLNDVPGFEGVRIHPGNTSADTEGCILPGMNVAPSGEAIVESRYAFGKVFGLIEDAIRRNEEVFIDVRNARRTI